MVKDEMTPIDWDHVTDADVVRAIREYDRLGSDQLATGRCLASGDFEGGKTGAVKVLTKLGFAIQAKNANTG